MDTPGSSLGSLKTSKWLIVALACITVISTLYVYDDFMLDQSESYESLTNRILRRRRGRKKNKKSKGSSPPPPADIVWIVGYPGSGHERFAPAVTGYGNVPTSGDIAPRTLVTASCTGYCMLSEGRKKCKNQYLKDSLSYSKWLSTCAGGARKRRKSKFVSTEDVKKLVIVKRDPFEIVYDRYIASGNQVQRFYPDSGDSDEQSNEIVNEVAFKKLSEWCEEIDKQALKKNEIKSFVKTIEENYAKEKRSYTEPLEFPPCFTEHLRIMQFYDNAMVLAKEKDTYVVDWNKVLLTDTGACKGSYGGGYNSGYGGWDGSSYYSCNGYAYSWELRDMTQKLVDAALLEMPTHSSRGCADEHRYLFSGYYPMSRAAENCVYPGKYKNAMASMMYYFMMSGDWTIKRHEWY